MSESCFTVVVCTRDRVEDLTRCLESLAHQFGDGDGQGWDVLVVDNGSSDGTSDYVRSMIEGYPVPLYLEREERMGLSIARNTGLRSAKGSAVVFVDDDVSFHDGWVKAWEEGFVDGSIVAAGGPIHPVFPDSVPAWFRDGVMGDGGTTTGHYYNGEEKVECDPKMGIGSPSGGNMAIRRKVALDVGGFREDLGWARKRIPAEETDLFARLRESDAKIFYFPGPVVNHHLDEQRTNIKYLRLWHRGYGRASILMKSPIGPLRWLLIFGEQAVNLAYFSIRLCLPGGQRCFRAHRKQGQAMGRLAQMVGL